MTGDRVLMAGTGWGRGPVKSTGFFFLANWPPNESPHPRNKALSVVGRINFEQTLFRHAHTFEACKDVVLPALVTLWEPRWSWNIQTTQLLWCERKGT